MKTSKKILLLGLILLIVAGVVVIALKGLNVSLMFRQHDSISLYIGKEMDFDEFTNICKEVFANKKVVIRKIELFNDAVNINVESITDEEKEALVKKINEIYVGEGEEEYTVEDINVVTIPNIRLRDIITPYIRPVAISGILIIAYMIIRFRKMKTVEIVGKLLLYLILTEVAILSFIAIVRIPVSATIINLMVAIAIVELVAYNFKLEKNID